VRTVFLELNGMLHGVMTKIEITKVSHEFKKYYKNYSVIVSMILSKLIAQESTSHSQDSFYILHKFLPYQETNFLP